MLAEDYNKNDEFHHYFFLSQTQTERRSTRHGGKITVSYSCYFDNEKIERVQFYSTEHWG